MKDKLKMALVPLLLGATIGCGDPGILQNEFLDIWCGDKLCAWNIHEGEIEKTATWHKRDYAVKMLGETVVLSQTTGYSEDDGIFGPEEIYCYFVNILADAEEGATLYLDVLYPTTVSALTDYIDYVKRTPSIDALEMTGQSDQIEWVSSHTIPADNWEESSRELGWDSNYRNVRIILRKSGEGDGVISRVTMLANTNCEYPSARESESSADEK